MLLQLPFYRLRMTNRTSLGSTGSGPTARYDLHRWLPCAFNALHSLGLVAGRHLFVAMQGLLRCWCAMVCLCVCCMYVYIYDLYMYVCCHRVLYSKILAAFEGLRVYWSMAQVGILQYYYLLGKWHEYDAGRLRVHSGRIQPVSIELCYVFVWCFVLLLIASYCAISWLRFFYTLARTDSPANLVLCWMGLADPVKQSE